MTPESPLLGPLPPPPNEEERDQYHRKYGFDPVVDLVRVDGGSFWGYRQFFDWEGESSLHAAGVQVGGEVSVWQRGPMAAILLRVADRCPKILASIVRQWRDSIVDSPECDEQNPPSPELTLWLSILNQEILPWEAFARLLGIIRRIALEGLRGLNPNFMPAGFNAALVRAIALAIRDIVPDVVTLSPRGIAVGGALVHPFLVPPPNPPGMNGSCCRCACSPPWRGRSFAPRAPDHNPGPGMPYLPSWMPPSRICVSSLPQTR